MIDTTLRGAFISRRIVVEFAALIAFSRFACLIKRETQKSPERTRTFISHLVLFHLRGTQCQRTDRTDRMDETKPISSGPTLRCRKETLESLLRSVRKFITS